MGTDLGICLQFQKCYNQDFHIGCLLLRAYVGYLVPNERAIKFYERFGFKPNGTYVEDHIGGKDVKELQYVYHIK